MKISILVPVYKVPYNYLKKCIESLINQSLKDIEIILVDDGSPDECGKICDEYALLDSRIIVVHQQNRGLSSARNTAFKKALGEYVMFLDGDDYIEQNACELAYDSAKKKNYEIVFWDVISEFSNSSKYNKTFLGESREFVGDECKILQENVLEFNGKIAQVFAKLIKRQFIIENNVFHEENLKQGAEGLVFNIKLFENATSCFYLNKGLNHWNYNEKSISHTASVDNNILIIRCFEFIEKFINDSINSEALRNKIYTRLLYVIVTTAVTGCFSPANKKKYVEKKKDFEKFMKEPIVKKALNKGNYKSLDAKRRIILFLIKNKFYCIISLIGLLRRISLNLK